LYFTVDNRQISRVIGATKKQWVLLLGRFTDGHDTVLNDLAGILRDRKFIPVTFNFEKPEKVDLIEAIILFAGLSAAVFVDITDPTSTPLELYAIVPHFAVPVVPLIAEGSKSFSLLPSLSKYSWVREPVEFVPGNLEAKATELLGRAGLINT
jgi:hypothetical protein